MGSVSECCSCGAEYRGFPPAGILICKECEAEVVEAMGGLLHTSEEDEPPGAEPG